MPETLSTITQLVITAIPLEGDAVALGLAVRRRLILKVLIEQLLNSGEEITTNGVEEVCRKGIPLNTCQVKERHNVKTRQWLKAAILNLADGTKHLRGVAGNAPGSAI